MKRVVVTGLGLVTPLGCGVGHVWRALLSGKCGISVLQDEGYEKIPSKIAAQVPRVDRHHTKTLGAGGEREALWKFDPLKYVEASELRTMSPASVYALAAAKEAVEQSGLDQAGVGDDVGVAIGMGMSDLEEITNSVNIFRDRGPLRISPYFVPRVLTNMAAGIVSIRYGFRGPNHSVSTACATGAHAIGDASNLIRLGAARAMVCGGTEACVTPLSLAGFCRLRALSTKYNNNPAKSSRPFDTKRDGFVMGEGAGVLVLEELESAVARGVPILAEVLGYGMSGDGHHMTAPSEDGRGAERAMQAALRQASLAPSKVSYVNAHATSTPLGDAIEVRAIGRLFKDCQKPFVSSMKGSLGHGLGAAGAIETCLSIAALYDSKIPPNLNLDQPDDDMVQLVRLAGASPLPWPQSCGRRVLLKNAFGFGGTNASLCIASWQ